MPSGLPSTLPKWAKTMLKPDSIAFSPVLLAAVDFLGVFHTSEAAAPSTWMHVQTSWKFSGSTQTADTMITTTDIAKIAGGNIDPAWTAQDFTNAAAQLRTLVATWLAGSSPQLTSIEHRFYMRTFNPPDNVKPYPPSGPPVHIDSDVGSGSGANGFSPPQSAMTHTERTPYRKHWGRTYWPLPGAGNVTTSGHWQPTIVNTWAQAVHDAYDTMMSNSLFPVVPVTQVDKAPSRTLLTVTAVEVDDVPDVIRRRRPKFATVRAILPVQ